jgi:hypothetical protein
MNAKSKQSNSGGICNNKLNDILQSNPSHVIWCFNSLDVVCWDLFVSFTFIF